MTSYPICEALLKNGERCRSVVVDADSADEHLRSFCGPHGDRVRQAAEQAGDEPADDEQEVSPEGEPGAGDDTPVTAQPVAAPGGPRGAIRQFASQNPHMVDEFFAGVLNADTTTWVSCPSCRKRVEVDVPNWPSRTRALELLLAEGFSGKPEPAPEPDEQRRAEYARYLDTLTDERIERAVAFDKYQRKLVEDYPRRVLRVFLDADFDEVLAIAKRHGWTLNDEDVARLRALCPPSVFERST